MGRTRSTLVAATRAVLGVGRGTSLFRVDAHGDVSRFGTVHFLHGQASLVVREGSRISLHDGVPWFLDDARPQGFLGRLFVQQNAELGFPPLAQWQPDDTFRALALRGEDLPGNLLVGDEAVARYFARCTGAAARSRLIPRPQREAAYPGAAARVLEGDLPGSSAGGEQPKFTAEIDDNGKVFQVIVKFTPPVATPVGARWADLLACEHLALDVLREAGVETASTELLDAGGRRFLEVARYDRVGLSGRRPVVTMTAVDAELVGHGFSWTAVANGLRRGERISESDLVLIARLEAFARLIANSDRHLGNVSFFWRDDDTFSLAPAYDMLPMAFAPTTGEVIDRTLPPALPDAGTVAVWRETRALAERYWETVLASPLVSAAFKGTCVSRARAAMLG